MGIRERRERERTARRQGILDAAARVFSERGFDAASVNEIAERAELNVATLYYYYPAKELLYLGVLERAIQIVVPELEEAARSTDDPRERLFRFFKSYVSFLLTYPEAQAVFRCLQTKPIEPGNDETAEMIERAYAGTRRSMGVLVRAIVDGMEKGVFSVDDPRETCAVVWASLNGLVQMASNKGVFREPLEDALLRRFTDLIVDGMSGGSGSA